jgi:hypothetical protein
MLKAARYKVYIGNSKVLDHVADGLRGNMDTDEFNTLKDKVTALNGQSGVVTLDGHHTPPKGLPSSKSPLIDPDKKATASASNSLFTDLKASEGLLTGDKAVEYSNQVYPDSEKTSSSGTGSCSSR